MKPQLVRATKFDVPVLLDQMERFYSIDAYPFNMERAEANLEYFLETQDLGRIWLVRLNEQPVGYVVLAFGFSFEYGGRDAFLDELYLEEVFRGKGLGAQIMALLEEEASLLEVKAIHLEVEQHNEKARRLYTNSGFSSNDRQLLTKKL